MRKNRKGRFIGIFSTVSFHLIMVIRCSAMIATRAVGRVGSSEFGFDIVHDI